jgi:hypothetical protein
MERSAARAVMPSAEGKLSMTPAIGGKADINPAATAKRCGVSSFPPMGSEKRALRAFIT